MPKVKKKIRARTEVLSGPRGKVKSRTIRPKGTIDRMVVNPLKRRKRKSTTL